MRQTHRPILSQQNTSQMAMVLHLDLYLRSPVVYVQLSRLLGAARKSRRER
jgi:hypothetical protein